MLIAGGLRDQMVLIQKLIYKSENRNILEN
jgi:hypothetical protein